MEVLPLAVSPSATHYVYLRKHEAKSDSSLPPDRTLFAVNLPVDVSERQLAQFFKAHGCGSIEKVVFSRSSNSQNAPSETVDDSDEAMDEDDDVEPVATTSKVTPLPTGPPPLHTSGHTAHIVFLDASSLHLALSLSKSKKSTKKLKWPPPSSEDQTSTGLSRLTSLFDSRRPSLSLARSHADTYMTSYEARLEASKLAQASKYKKGEAIVDEDGFTLVTRGGAYGATLGGGAGVASRKFQLEVNSGTVGEVEKRKKKKKEKKDFYTFQIREQKRKGEQFCSLLYLHSCNGLLIGMHLSVRFHGPTAEVRRRQGEDCETERVETVQTLLDLSHQSIGVLMPLTDCPSDLLLGKMPNLASLICDL